MRPASAAASAAPERAEAAASAVRLLPEGLEPLGVWDVDESWGAWRRHLREAGPWARDHIRDSNRTVRAEFYLLDAPLAVVYRLAEDSSGRLIWRDGPVCEEPAVEVLDELPPAHLLRLPASRKPYSRLSGHPDTRYLPQPEGVQDDGQGQAVS